MHLIKKIAEYLFYIGYGTFSSYIFPSFLLGSFNFLKGIAHNPEGVLFIPIAATVVLAILILDFWILRKAVKSSQKNKLEKVCVFALFIITFAIGVVQSIRVWKDFFYCLSWHLQH